MTFDSADYLSGYRAAQACARELVTLRLLDELPQAEDLARRLEDLNATPHATTALVEVLVGAVANQWGSVEEFSAQVVLSLAEDDIEGGWG